MAGHTISDYLDENPKHEIISWGRENFLVGNDLYDWKNKLFILNSEKKIDLIINCIGILKQQANENPLLAVRINSLFPHELADFGSSLEIKLIHLSTDCWTDLDSYGRSIRAGEINYPNNLFIRTSIVGIVMEI